MSLKFLVKNFLGFTLVEIIIVVAVIAILVAIAVPAVQKARMMVQESSANIFFK